MRLGLLNTSTFYLVIDIRMKLNALTLNSPDSIPDRIHPGILPAGKTPGGGKDGTYTLGRL